uniref:Uncharacterized protein n=1 Tax=Candidatus Kentrum sp. DK TaxID=2126562 RepID=A0A450RVJ9_9GAMM|nr:MAG: hypothetical protein BECKDK2373B_GA0170837_100425 [Candidatus Kentron sp. DK]VFJ55652.1 MAG: hypothetical protein BECKDK2373C_GA0170839_104933 [Candidatus Kentron sp. DK]
MVRLDGLNPSANVLMPSANEPVGWGELANPNTGGLEVVMLGFAPLTPTYGPSVNELVGWVSLRTPTLSLVRVG